MDTLDVTIEAILKCFVSNYVRKSLEKIDEKLEALVASEDRDAIKQYVAEKQLADPLAALAGEALQKSFVLPMMPLTIASLEDRAELFQHVLGIGFAFSNQMQADLLLPGSLHSRDTIISFVRNKAGIPEITRKANRVTLKETSLTQNQAFIFPCPAVDAKEIFATYKEQLVYHFENSEGYFSHDISNSVQGWDNCKLTAVTAGACQFQYASLMKGEVHEYFLPKNGNASIKKDWLDGLREMFAAAGQIPNLRYLTAEQTKEIKEAYRLFESLN